MVQMWLRLSSQCQTAEAYLETMSSFLGYFHSPGRLISEPLESASQKILTLRVALLLALTLLKRVRGLQALSVALPRFHPWTG